MNAEHEEAVEFAKVSKRENRVYVGNLSYDVKYRDLMEFMRGGGWGKSQISFSISCTRGWRQKCGLVVGMCTPPSYSREWCGFPMNWSLKACGEEERVFSFLPDGMVELSRGY